MVVAQSGHPHRSIPACAGEPPRPGRRRGYGLVYPRVCGGTRYSPWTRRISTGLSPRVRGNPGPAGPDRQRVGSIPACAGEPCTAAWGTPSPRVYPRVCGGTRADVGPRQRLLGLSPRVRGNLGAWPDGDGRRGSIPACAGEPALPPVRPSMTLVYPRVCGGTVVLITLTVFPAGLSPRVRGNHSPFCHLRGAGRSIPACAGEPLGTTVPPTQAPVYPRVCGGTAGMPWWAGLGTGLSPRVRGNRRQPGQGLVVVRSIPACAGEPSRWLRSGALRWVYPRVCGGTHSRRPPSSARGGLSPRVRGNPEQGQRRHGEKRSIPACAGEPSFSSRYASACWVYPRVCGGTANRRPPPLLLSGLSPRVRGNQRESAVHLLCEGSIPACAGEPTPRPCPHPCTTVYPRVCGGTDLGDAAGQAGVGLSPRVRGNLGRSDLPFPAMRSIPACAGEPGPCR